MNQEMWEFFHRLIAEQKSLTRQAFGFVISYILIATLVYVLLDTYAYEEDSLYGLVGMLLWGLGYVLFLGLMQNGGLTHDGTRTGIGTYFALGIAIGIPVGLAFVVLIIPGLYLLMRWLPAYSRALISQDGIGNAMQWSWERTEPWQRPLSLAMVFPILMFGVSVGADLIYFYGYDFFDWPGFVILSIIWNGAVSIGLAWVTIYGVAAFKLLADQPVGDPEAAESRV